MPISDIGDLCDVAPAEVVRILAQDWVNDKGTCGGCTVIPQCMGVNNREISIIIFTPGPQCMGFQKNHIQQLISNLIMNHNYPQVLGFGD